MSGENQMIVPITRAAAALGFGGGKPVSNRTLRKFAQRRRKREGFPWGGKFETAEEVEAYFSGDQIQCLECGRTLRSLAGHVTRIHGITIEQYQEKYGLPWGRGLVCDESRDKYAAAMRKRLEDDESLRATLMAGRKLRFGVAVRPRAQFIKNAQTDRVQGAVHYVRHDDDDAEEFLRRVYMGRTPSEVAADEDMPGRTWFYAYRRDHAEFDTRYRDAVEALPFAVQAKMGSLGQRFKAAVRNLFEQGLSDHAIARDLGVTAMSCNKITKPLRRQVTQA